MKKIERIWEEKGGAVARGIGGREEVVGNCSENF